MQAGQPGLAVSRVPSTALFSVFRGLPHTPDPGGFPAEDSGQELPILLQELGTAEDSSRDSPFWTFFGHLHNVGGIGKKSKHP